MTKETKGNIIIIVVLILVIVALMFIGGCSHVHIVTNCPNEPYPICGSVNGCLQKQCNEIFWWWQ